MKRRKIVAIQTQKLEQWIIRPCTAPKFRLPCEQCGWTNWLKVGGAGMVAELSTSKICELTASGRLHSTLGPDGSLLICGRSLELLNIEGGEKNNER